MNLVFRLAIEKKKLKRHQLVVIKTQKKEFRFTIGELIQLIDRKIGYEKEFINQTIMIMLLLDYDIWEILIFLAKTHIMENSNYWGDGQLLKDFTIEIERKRKEMIRIGMEKGLTHKQTIKISQEIDELMNLWINTKRQT